MTIRFYDVCSLCGSKYYVHSQAKTKYCEKCKPVVKRAWGITNRNGQDVDFAYVKKLLGEDRCVYCGRKIEWSEKQIDHKTPLSRGGTNDNSNLCLSCAACNHDKDDMTAEEYYEWKKLDNRMPELGVRQKVLELLSQNPLTQIVTTVTSKTKKECYNPPIIKNITVKDDDGHIIGYKKIKIDTKILGVKKVTTKEQLTKFGEIYNTVCRLANKKIIKCKTKTITTEEVISEY